MYKLVFNLLGRIFKWMKRSIFLIGCIFFLTTNLLTLTSGFVQAALSTSLGMLGISSIYSVLDSTIRSQNAKIRKLNSAYKEASKGKKQLLKEKGKLSKELVDEKRKRTNLQNDLNNEKSRSGNFKTALSEEKSRTKVLKMDNQKIRATNAANTKIINANKAAVKSIGGQVTRRTLKSAALNVGSIPFESAPFVGAAVVVVVTSYELHMACDSVADMNEIYRNMGIEPDDDPGFTQKTCGGYIEQIDKLSKQLSDNFDIQGINKSVDSLLADLNFGNDDN